MNVRLASLVALLVLASIPLPAAAGTPRPGPERDRESPPERLSKEELAERAAGLGDRVPVGWTVAGHPRIESHSPSGLDWSFLGPRPIENEYWSNLNDASGRVSAVLPHPNLPGTVYAAAAMGGVWRTSDDGATWTPLTDGLSSLSSGALCFAPDQPETLFFATGEQHLAIDNFPGDGLFRSLDAGANWTKIAGAGDIGNYVARIAAHASTPGLMYAASDLGFMRSVDGGVTWSANFAGDWCTDLAVNPVNNDVVLSAHWGIGIFKSPDGGVSQMQLTTGLPVAGSGFGRIHLAIAPADTGVVYASFHDEASGGLFGLYRSDDGGATWAQIPDVPNYLGTQGWYDHTIIVDPDDPDIVFAGGVFPYDLATNGIVRSIDGGASWTDVMAGANGQTVHPDVHHLAWDAAGRLWVGCDGGVWRSSDLGANWTNCNADLEITQFYFVGVHPTDDGRLLGGTQDNGTLQYFGAIGWPQWIGGDGGATLYEQGDPSHYYSTYVRLNPVYRWLNFGYDGDATGPWVAAADRASFIFSPLIEDPNVPGGLLAGTYRVWRSDNRGTLWSAISGDLTDGTGVLYSLAIADGDPDKIYAGTTDSRVQVTSNGGASWDLRVSGLGSGRVRRIVLNPLDSDEAYCVQERRTLERVFHTTDAGQNWTGVSGDLPSGVLTLCLAVDWRPAVPRLYAGTDRGVFVSRDGGATWLHADTDLPGTAVYDLVLDLANDWLVAATHGRGMWRATTDVTAPSVSVLAPNGGETEIVGSSTSLDWTASDDATVESVDVELSRNGLAGPWEPIATGVPNSGSVPWIVTAPVTTTALLRVTAHDNSANAGEDLSDAEWTIAAEPTAVPPSDARVANFNLAPVAPNPTSGAARIAWVVPVSADVRVSLMDTQGRELVTFAKGRYQPGSYVVTWDGRVGGAPAPAGLYFVRLWSAAGAEFGRRRHPEAAEARATIAGGVSRVQRVAVMR